jgi:hypothetical protein
MPIHMDPSGNRDAETIDIKAYSLLKILNSH